MVKITISPECFIRAQANKGKLEIVFVPDEEVRQFFGGDTEEITLGFTSDNPADDAEKVDKYVKEGHEIVLEAEGKLL